jgi:hypothetical protein
MLKPLLGSINSERVLLFILVREEGYATEIARFFDVPINAIQQQLEKFEQGAVLVSKKIGGTRLYRFNPRYPFLASLKNLLNNALSFYPQEARDRLAIYRKRPRKKGKPD